MIKIMNLFGGNKKLLLIHGLAGLIFVLLLFTCLKHSKIKTTNLSPQEEKSRSAREIKTIPLREVKPGLLPDDFSDFIYKHYSLLSDYCEAENIKLGLSVHDFQFKTYRADLNNDGQPEYFIFPWEICGQSVRGASGNGPIHLYQKAGDAWETMTVFEGGDVVLLEEKNDGYYNFRSHMKLSADSGCTTDYHYLKDRKEYTFKYFPVSQEWYYYAP